MAKAPRAALPRFDEERSNKPFDAKTIHDNEVDSDADIHWDEAMPEWSSATEAPDAALVALDDLAKKIQTDFTALCMALSAEFTANEQKLRAYEVVAVMKQRLCEHFEKSIAPTRLPLLHHAEVSPDGAPGVANGKEAMRPNTVSCATAVKAVQVIGKLAGAESIKPDRSGISEPTSMDSDGISVKSELGTVEPASLEFTTIYVGGIPMTMTKDKLRVALGAKFEATIIERYHEKAKVGHAKVRILMGRFGEDELDQGLELESSVTGQRLRIAKWQSSKSPAPAVARANKARQEQKSKAVKQKSEMARHHVKSEQARQASFVADFLHAQAAPNGRRLYSQVISNVAEARMKSMETAILNGVRQLLERLTEHRQ